MLAFASEKQEQSVSSVVFKILMIEEAGTEFDSGSELRN